MIYVDASFVWPSNEPQAHRAGARHGHRWCHMWCDPGEEEQLHALARKIGMKRYWFQDKPGRLPHYDLVPTKRAAAIKHGAVEKSLLDYKREHLPRMHLEILETQIEVAKQRYNRPFEIRADLNEFRNTRIAGYTHLPLEQQLIKWAESKGCKAFLLPDTVYQTLAIVVP